VKNSTLGVKNVDSHSQYRIGSISKLFTVYTFLIEAGDVKFNDPITKYVPELAAAARHEQNAVDSVDWESVTVGNLASQMSGIGRDCESGFSILCSPLNSVLQPQ
jgi:CubicO group peptidase (beta-lactamase class C family)